MNLRSMLCALLLLCYYTFLTFILGSGSCTAPMCRTGWYQIGWQCIVPHHISSLCFILTGTGEGDVAEAERLLKPFRLRYPRVSANKSFCMFELNVLIAVVCCSHRMVLQ